VYRLHRTVIYYSIFDDTSFAITEINGFTYYRSL